MKPLQIILVLLGVFSFGLKEWIAAADSPAAEKSKPCFTCNGTGKVTCPNGKDGEADCPGPCLKLNKGVWVHMDVQGHPPTDIWQKFKTANRTWAAWNQNHVGDVIEYQNGNPVNIGKCKICGGTGHVKCKICDGSGEIDCPMCDGKKVVPESWTAFDNPKMKVRPTHYKLKDGQTLVGKKVMAIGDDVTIRTSSGNVQIKQSDIVSEENPSQK